MQSEPKWRGQWHSSCSTALCTGRGQVSGVRHDWQLFWDKVGGDLGAGGWAGHGKTRSAPISKPYLIHPPTHTCAAYTPQAQLASLSSELEASQLQLRTAQAAAAEAVTAASASAAVAAQVRDLGHQAVL